MTKTLAIILNHNLPENTDALYTSLAPWQGELYDLKVMDNASEPSLQSQYTDIFLPENIYWGGALNKAFTLVLDDPVYDSLLFLNNDIELNGENFVVRLREALFQNDLAIVTPCMAGQANPWRQMMNWATTGIRCVPWIDNQAPLFHRKIIESIRQFDDRLIYGWGQELVCHEVCVKHNWKIGICDYISVIHYGHMTFKKERFMKGHQDADGEELSQQSFKDFSVKAYQGFKSYFQKDLKRYQTMHAYGNKYDAGDIKLVDPKQTNTRTFRSLLDKLFE